QEPNIDARIAQIRALKKLKRLRAIPEFQQLLHDPSMRVAVEAVSALRDLAPTLRDQAPDTARQLAADLWAIGAQRAGAPGGEEFRALTIEVVGLLRARAFIGEMLKFLAPNE